jgi:hypothetical protein
VAAHTALGDEALVLEDEGTLEVAVAAEAAAVVRAAHQRRGALAVWAVAIEAGQHSLVHLVMLGEGELRAYLEVTAVAQLRCGLGEEVLAGAVQAMAVGACLAGERMVATLELMQVRARRVTFEADGRARTRRPVRRERLEIPNALAAAGVGVRLPGAVAGLAAAQCLGPRRVGERRGVRGRRVRLGLGVVARPAHVLACVGGCRLHLGWRRFLSSGCRLLLRGCGSRQRGDQTEHHEGQRHGRSLHGDGLKPSAWRWQGRQE